METDSQFGENSRLRRYLLGELSEDEQAKVEESLFATEGLWEELSLMEEDIIDAYVRGELPAPERARFESHFLSSPRRTSRVAFARSLLSAEARPTPEPSRDRGRRWFDWLLPQPARPVFALSAAVIVLAVTGAAVFLTLSARLTALRNESAQLRQQLQKLPPQVHTAPGAEELLAQVRKEMDSRLTANGRGAAGSAPESVPFLLVPGLERGPTASRQQIAIPQQMPSVRLLLPLGAGKRYPGYRVVLQNSDSEEVWGRNGIIASPGPEEATVAVELPSTLLKPGDYRVLVTGVTSAGDAQELENYFVFRVPHR